MWRIDKQRHPENEKGTETEKKRGDRKKEKRENEREISKKN